MAQSSSLRAVVVTDWERCPRGVLWVNELEALGVDFKLIRLADSLVSESRQDPTSLIRDLEARQVLILNFDCINGDPAFGSDIALDWFRYRYPELLKWVEDGGILIVEGQAMLAVPTQASYDALFGDRELRVSGPSVTPLPGLEFERTGGECRVTRQACKYGFFVKYGLCTGTGELRCTDNRTIADFFPGNARFMLSAANDIYEWKLLYRGWFRVLAPWCRFRWIPLIVTNRKKFGFDHPVLLAAGHGRGVMFVSTMWLAGTGQTAIIRSLLEWNPRNNPLPEPRRRKIIEVAVSAAISAIAAWLISDVLKIKGAGSVAVRTFLSLALWAAYWLVRTIGPFLWKIVTEFI
jgi:hypothetical protein